ncbi:MAG: hypothetical protein UW65_C0004G0011 [candidate division WWE3 bacterium GW2011_GWB1_44_4]|uniref:Uncharacterized protein n=3 Tax=Katanobacteria TaxID=422282 RepID=A0A0G1KNV7_UNCKA|nr:MAG: hypothetical protein UW65_C0004G0011 [candidate division WWE3 bacterium GW2011_GWB1_44_4]KKT85155.1 MAG: hypothetical protein UW82_C0002G0025 [candidate division WWE3 bacterium GW2011_GWC2_44_9]OGC51870.1 MAG: hypothetical protein A2709_00735 [candidate division WWE3 bacterium RIFCSPHIGHO2_01_FULL_43_9]
MSFVTILAQSKIFPVLEFSLIIALVIVTYWGMYLSAFKNVKPVTKMTLSMFLGTVGYIIGKTTVIALFASHFSTTAAYAF